MLKRLMDQAHHRAARRLSALVLVATLGAALAACGSSSPSSSGTSTTVGPPVTLGILSANIDPTLLTLLKGNYFKQVGLNVDVKRFDSGVPQVAAMVSGAIDIGYVAVSPLISIAAQGTAVKAIALAYVGGTQALVVNPRSGINTIADLKGKSVGYVKGSIQEYAMQTILAQHGLSLSDVTSVNLPVALMAAAYEKGSVDAEMAAQASLYQVLASGAKILIRPENVPGAGISGVTTYAASQSFLTAHPAEAAKFDEALELARRAVHNDKSAALQTLESQAGVSASSGNAILASVVTPPLSDLVKGGYAYNLTSGGLANQMTPVIQFMLGKKEIKAAMASSSLVDGSVAQAALKDLGS